MDEPTVGLDTQSRLDILQLVENLNDNGMTILYTTHHMQEAERVCNRIGIIEEGSLLVEGNPSELTRNKADKFEIKIVLQDLNFLKLNKPILSQYDFEVDYETNTLCVACDDLNREIIEIIYEIQKNGGTIADIDSSITNLENLFLRLRI